MWIKPKYYWNLRNSENFITLTWRPYWKLVQFVTTPSVIKHSTSVRLETPFCKTYLLHTNWSHNNYWDVVALNLENFYHYVCTLVKSSIVTGMRIKYKRIVRKSINHFFLEIKRMFLMIFTTWWWRNEENVEHLGIFQQL